MYGMFTDCNKLKEIKGIEKFEKSQITNMRYMLVSCCNELKDLDYFNYLFV